jgi:hypothetical protein
MAVANLLNAQSSEPPEVFPIARRVHYRRPI